MEVRKTIVLDMTIRFIHRYPPSVENVRKLWMHPRTLFRRPPLYENSTHIIRNERTVTIIDGEYRGGRIGRHVVQIAAKSVNGTDVYAGETKRQPPEKFSGRYAQGQRQTWWLPPGRNEYQGFPR